MSASVKGLSHTAARTSDIQELLLLSKAQPPAAPEQLEELRRISRLDVTDYVEQEVRAEVIDPVLRVLGYQKQTSFSVKREKKLYVGEKLLAVDYSVTLWEDDFWVIEAKRPLRRLTHKELRQALEYACHPDINAALVVLCDGQVFEVYDREESLTRPVARVEVKNLAEEFHVLQALLAPWQAWFFQKRRVLRLIDRVLDKEVQLARLQEFADAVGRRVEGKRGKVLENWRSARPLERDGESRAQDLEGMTIHDLVDGEFFLPGLPAGDLHRISSLLREKARPGAFDVLYLIFPDLPRPMNDNFVAAALRALIEFEAHDVEVTWLPEWLGGGRGKGALQQAVRAFIASGLSSFERDLGRKLVLQYAACARRIAKIFSARLPGITRAGVLGHELLRWTADELSFAQAISTPAAHSFGTLNGLQSTMTGNFVSECRKERGKFDIARGEVLLRDAWQLERQLLKDGAEYWKAVKGRGLLSEGNPTESAWVTCDWLGHMVLCILASSSPKWLDYTLQVHAADVHRLAPDSWQARVLLGIPVPEVLPMPSDKERAHRFFAGDEQLFRDLAGAYSNRSALA